MLLLTIWCPPEFPELPSTYTQWVEHTSYSYIRNNSYYDEYNYIRIIDSTIVPYALDISILKKRIPCGDSLLGEVEYYDSTHTTNQELYLSWFPHEDLDTISRKPLYQYDGYISYDTMGFEKITIDNREAWRIRGAWWRTYIDGGVHERGFFTNYYIQTKRLDYRITCISMTYIYDDYGPDCAGLVHYPNRITELEQAVEQTFKPKEEILQPIADTHIFLGPPLPAGYSNWRKRLTLCNEERKLSYFAYMGTVSTTEIQPLPFFFEGLVTQPGLICGDSLRGSVILPLESDSIPQVMHVYLRPAGELSLDVANVKSELISLSARPEDFISLDRAGVEELSINGNRAFRLRTWQYGPADKELSATTSSVTAYLIHSQKSDYIVICSNCLYKSAGLTKNGQERFYPDRIAELEQAVEQTFRPK